MKTKDFTITFSGLKLGSHEFNYDLNDTFFELFEFSDYSDLKGVAQMKMLKSETVLFLSEIMVKVMKHVRVSRTK